jgi:hypothetical protein
MNKDISEQISDILDWINTNNKTNNTIDLSRANTRLGYLSITLGKMVTDAYELYQSLEAEYDAKYAKKKKELVESGKSSAGAEDIVKGELADLKLDVTKAKISHKKLDSYLNRLDKQMDAVKQQISTINKTDLKRLND